MTEVCQPRVAYGDWSLDTLRAALDELAEYPNYLLPDALAAAQPILDHLDHRRENPGPGESWDDVDPVHEHAEGVYAGLEARHLSHLGLLEARGESCHIADGTLTVTAADLTPDVVMRIRADVVATRPRRRVLPRPRGAGRPAGHRPVRRSGASSSTSSADPGEPDPPLPHRRRRCAPGRWRGRAA